MFAFTFLYMLCAVLLSLYAASTLILLIAYWRYRHSTSPTPHIATWPTVAVQLPIYNEAAVVERLLRAVTHLDYPQQQLIIQVLDDSNDETSDVIAQCAAQLRAQGHNIQHVRRENRQGYKAGALQHGLSLLDAEYVMVLDADFLPSPDFLRKTIPHLVTDPSLGMVQTRWGHLNPADNVLTRGQMLALDGHFVIEQTARNRAGWFINFSGSGGVWRTKAIRDAGGWSASTLTEDLDLSYRSQLAGWNFLYLPDVVVPAELPPQIAAYKQQQARWAQGSTQTLVNTLSPLWHANIRFDKRIMATLHLCQYLPHPLMILLLLLTPLLILTDKVQLLPLGPLGLIGLAPPLLYVVSQRAIYRNWHQHLLAFPALLALGTGIAWNNTIAVINGLCGQPMEFRRTPKFAKSWTGSRYALKQDRTVWGEIMLAIYAIIGTGIAIIHYPPLVPYLALYGGAFAFVAGWSLHDLWVLQHSA